MSSNETATPDRPKGPRAVKSFTRMESPSPGLFPRNRSKTVQDISLNVAASSPGPLSSPQEDSEKATDVFERPEDLGHENDNEELEPTLLRPENLPERFDELPIELMSLTDRYIVLPQRIRSKSSSDSVQIRRIP